MKIIIKRVGGEVESITKEYLVYVMSDTKTSIKAEVCDWDELHEIIQKLKKEYPIQETIYFDI
jgi:hypothetical protein